MGVMGQANRKLSGREKGCGGTIKSGEATLHQWEDCQAKWIQLCGELSEEVD